MGSKYPILSPEKIIKAFSKIGYSKVSQKGSHLKLRKKEPVKRVVIVPIHDEIARGTLKSILEQAKIDLEYFLTLLD